MLMVVDIGNTNITIGLYNGETLTNTYRMTTTIARTSDEFGTLIFDFLNTAGIRINEIEDVFICSVVPKIMHAFTNSIRKYIYKEPILLGPGIKSGISIQTENPKAVGADRIADLAGCYHNYHGNVLVIDFGTATTYDYLSENGEFKYGVTAPGLRISADALWENCAKLPEIEIEKPDSILAMNTITSMQAGLVYGYIGATEYIINKFKEELKHDFTVIATGGLGRIIAANTDLIDIFDAELTFKGLRSIYLRNTK